ncbi:hypothetical protein A4A49_03638 [Nicotiana attenuata]|uniref:Uncharacterized protein n=1 Tax=Nicotiana attenuata TaxID=49451 RepID=A0A314LBQ3_NICAT|nr:hypothetical protein A4A49_03638 [Nicotiana attenuata]
MKKTTLLIKTRILRPPGSSSRFQQNPDSLNSRKIQVTMVTAMDCRSWDEDMYRDSILLERESQCRTVFRTAFAPNTNPNRNSYPDLIVAATALSPLTPSPLAS